MKNLILSIILLLALLSADAQVVRDTFDLGDKGNLYLASTQFDSGVHQISIIQMQNWYMVSAIDGQLFFGTDGAMPTFELKEAYVIDTTGNRIDLEVNGMYESNMAVFKNISDTDGGYYLTCTFSGGSGVYVAQWLIRSNTSMRTILSNDQRLLRWVSSP